MAEISLEHLSKTFPNGVHAVQDLSLNLARGELVVLVGPSGSGKTTTLRLIAGLEKASAGTVRIGGRVVNALPPHERQVALVFQRPGLYPHLTVKDNLGFSLKLRTQCSWLSRLVWHRWHSRGRAAIQAQDQEAATRIRETARLLRLEDLLERRADQLSGGQQQRVALGRALVRGAEVFLLDEPLSNLEFRLRFEMRRELHLLQRRFRATMIYVTHDPGEALALGDRIVVLDRGQAQQIGPPLEILDRPANRFVASFINWPPLNFVDGHMVAEGSGLWFSAAPWRWLLPLPWEGCKSHLGKAVTLGIRPEDIQIGETEKEKPSFSPGPDNRQPATAIMEVALLEAQGAANLVTLRHGDRQMLAQVPRGPELRFGQTVMVTINLHKGLWFDSCTGIALDVRRGAG
jgi:multiple sugar transport system ATP-binding protein